MTKDKTSIQISPKTIIWVGVILVGLIATMFVMDSIHEKRKYQRFLELNEKTTHSPHMDKLNTLAKNLGKNDTLLINRIKEQLHLLILDIAEISTCEVIIPCNEGFIKINKYKSEIDIVGSLPSEEDQVITLLSSENKDRIKKEIFDITESDYKVWTMIKLENGYLIATRFRD